MKKSIIYIFNDSLNIVTPTGEIPLEEVALKDVPAGIAYKIIDTNLIPTDRTFRNAWETDMSDPDGYGIGHDAWIELKKGEQNDNN